jgi:hypothetical protein
LTGYISQLFWNKETQILIGNEPDMELLPSIASKGTQKNTHAIEKSITLIGLFGILGLIFGLMTINIFVFGAFNPPDRELLMGNETRWLIELTFFGGLTIVCFILLIWLLRKNILPRYIDQYYHKLFWHGYFSSLLIQIDASINKKEAISKSVNNFKDKYPEISKFLNVPENIEKDALITLIEFANDRFAEIEDISTFIIPPSVSKLLQFYAYATIIAGLLANLLIDPITTIIIKISEIIL